MKSQQITRPHRPTRRWLTVLALLALLLATAAPADDDDASWLERLRPDRESGTVDAGALLDAIGRDWDTRRDRWEEKAAELRDKRRALTREQLERLAAKSDGALTVIDTPDGPELRVDRLRLRRRTADRPDNAREALAEIFPELAAKAAAQYGMTIRRPPDTADDAPLPAHVVVLVHGLDEPGRLWRDLVPALHEHGYTVLEFNYPNDQRIHDSAQLLYDELVACRRRGVERVSIVAHSMGGLVARETLGSPLMYRSDPRGGLARPGVARLITLGTPHGGSKLANLRAAAEVRDQVARAFSGDGMLFGGVFDGSGEAREDLLPDSTFITNLNARPLPKGVALTVIASSASPVTAEKIAAFEANLRRTMSAEAAREFTDSIRQVADGVGDGAVPIESSKWVGVDDYHLLQANHLTMIRNYLPQQKTVPPAIPLILERLGYSLVE